VPQSDVPGEQHVAHAAVPTGRPRLRARRSPSRTSTRTCRRRAPRHPRAPAQLPQRGAVHAPKLPGSIEMPGHSGGPTGAAWRWIPDAASCTSARWRCRRCCGCFAGRQRGRARRARGRPPSFRDEAARLTRQANEALRHGPLRLTSPYDFMFSSTYLSPIGAAVVGDRRLRPQHGDIKWRVPHGRVTAPATLAIPSTVGCALAARRSAGHGGGLPVRRIRSDKTLRAYDRPTGAWSGRSRCRGVRRRAGLVRIGGRQFIVLPGLAGGTAGNPARFPTLPPRHRTAPYIASRAYCRDRSLDPSARA
jgi:hypothetical protein